MFNENDLSQGILERLLVKKEAVKEPFTIQVLFYKQVIANQFRLDVTDGSFRTSACLLSPQLNYLIRDNELEPNSIVEVTNYEVTSSNQRTILHIKSLSITHAGNIVAKRITSKAKMLSLTGDSQNVQTILPPAKELPTENTTTTSSQKRQQPTKEDNNPSERLDSLHQPRAKSLKTNSLSNNRTIPIYSLMPYSTSWTIKATCTEKSSIRNYHNSRREGTVFDFTLADATSSIQCVGFDGACEKFFNLIKPANVYYLTKANVKRANPSFNRTDNEFQLVLNEFTTRIELSQMDSQQQQKEINESLLIGQYQPISIKKLVNIEVNSTIDLLAICGDVGQMETIVVRTTGRQQFRRNVWLVDSSGVGVQLTLWAELAEKFAGRSGDVVLAKKLTVTDFGGRSLSARRNCQLFINPKIVESDELLAWYRSVGRDGSFPTVGELAGRIQSSSRSAWTKWSCIADIPLASKNEDEYDIEVKAFITGLKGETCLYRACQNPDCNKKKLAGNCPPYHCNRCQTDTDQFVWCYLLQAVVADFSGNCWVTFFDDTAATVLGRTAGQLAEIRDSQLNSQFEAVFEAVKLSSWLLTLSVGVDRFGDRTDLVKLVCRRLSRVDCRPVRYEEFLLRSLNSL